MGSYGLTGELMTPLSGQNSSVLKLRREYKRVVTIFGNVRRHKAPASAMWIVDLWRGCQTSSTIRAVISLSAGSRAMLNILLFLSFHLFFKMVFELEFSHFFKHQPFDRLQR